jgi:adenylate cyclase
MRLNHFYWVAADRIFKYDGTLDKMAGDSVMAFFGEPFHDHDHAERAVQCGLDILAAVKEITEPEPLPVGAGIATGEAFIGNVGHEDATDFTVLGDTVNIAARLQGEAAPGELLISEATYQAVQAGFPDAPERQLDLKGKTDLVPARVLKV